jgi:hypothetical protein
VNDVAQQTRGPLMLASSLLQKAAKKFARERFRDDVEGVVSRTLAEIGKADITFERLAEGLGAIKQPVRERVRVDLRACLADIVTGLPARDQLHINYPEPGSPLIVVGDPGRLRFAFRSILGYLLRRRSDDDGSPTKIEVVTRTEGGWSSIKMFIAGAPTPDIPAYSPNEQPKDALWEGTSRGLEDSALGLDVIGKIIEAHGGKLIKTLAPTAVGSLQPAWLGMQIDLPSPNEGGHTI